MDDKLTVNLIDEKVTASGLNDDSVVVDNEDETLNVSFQDERLGATLGDSELDVQLAVGTFREHDYNKLINKFFNYLILFFTNIYCIITFFVFFKRKTIICFIRNFSFYYFIVNII